MRLEEGIEFVQAAILLRDTILQPRYRTEERVWRSEDQTWRREDRQWRGEDMEWRQEEQRFMCESYCCPGKKVKYSCFCAERVQFRFKPGHQQQNSRNNQKQWRLHDLEQRSLDNARVIWGRFMEKNRRDVEERAEQLKSLGNLAALVAGFAVVAFLEFGDDVGFKRNHALTLAFGTTAALVVGLNMNVMVSTSLLHASILRSGKMYVNEAAEAEFMQQCLAFVTRFQAGMDPPAPRRTFEKHWDSRCERDWRWAFMLFVSGLVCFALNLVLATWIKFRHVPTCIVVTTLLALSLVFVGRLLAFWAPDLFSRRPWTDDALRAHVLQLGSDTGMPFAWHRVPRQADVPRDGADSNFQDADSAFTYVNNSSNAGSDTSTAFPPVATAFSTMSQPVQNQDFQEAYMDMQSLVSAAITQENRGNSVPHSAYPMNDHVGSREHHEAHYTASDRLRRSSSAHGGTDGDSNRMQTHTMYADGGTEWDAGLRTGSWRSPSQSQSRSPRPRVQNGSADALHAAPVDSRAQSRHRGNADMYTAHGATQRSPNQPRAVAEGVTSEQNCCEGCAHQSMRMHQRAMRHTRAQCCSRREVCGVSNREREYSGNVFQPLHPTVEGRVMGQGGGRCAWGGKHVKCVGRRTSSSGA